MDFKARFEGRKAFINTQGNTEALPKSDQAQQKRKVIVLR